MYRTKYLFGAFSGIFALLYLLFGVVGFEDARTFMDRYTAFGLSLIHSAIAIALLVSSYREKKREDRRLRRIVESLLLVHPVLTAELLAQATGMSMGDAYEFIAKELKHTL